MGRSHPSRGSRRAFVVTLGTIALLLGAPFTALASWPQYQGGAAHNGGSDGPTAPLVEAWANGDIELGGPDARGGLSAPVVAEDGTIVVVAPTAVLGFSPSDGSPVFEAERDFGPSSQPAVAAGPDGPIVVFSEGYGDQPPAATASPTASPSPSPAEPGDGEAFDSHVDAVDLAGDRVWGRPVQLDAVAIAPIAVDDRSAYVGDVDGGVTALDLATGRERWTADVRTTVPGAPAPVEGRVYVSALGSQTTAGAVVALDTSDGEPLWRTDDEAIRSNVVSAPVLTETALLVLEATAVTSLDPEDGSVRWRTEIVNPLRSPPFFFQGTATPAPVPADGDVFVVDVTGRVYALDAETGEILWDYALNDPSPVSPPVVTAEHVLVPTDSGTLYAIDRDSGRLAWRIDASARGFLRGLADAGDVLVAVAGSDDASLVAVGPDPDAVLLDEPSPTTFDLGRLLAGFALGGLAFGAIAVAALGPVQRRLGPAIAPEAGEATEGEDG